MPYANRERRLEYLRSYRAANPDYRVRTVYQRARRDAIRAWVREQKDRPCADCGGRFHPVAMDFDHRPGEAKLFDINSAVSTNKALARVVAEAAKCDVVCANCHRLRTWERMQA